MGQEGDFEAYDTFQGARPGYAFKTGIKGTGYYFDRHQIQTYWDQVVSGLPENWRDAKFREAKLLVDDAKGCGLGMAHSAFGLVVETVEVTPGQDLQPGEVIVAVEGRSLAGLSAPQMEASFQKRRLQGARLLVASFVQVKEMAEKDPNIVEMWDHVKQHSYYFHKKTGRSAWTPEELKKTMEKEKEKEKKPQAPIDLAHFLQHGFAKPKELPRKVKPKAQASANHPNEQEMDEADLAREERKRWREWNEGGGYTEQFLARYKGARVDEPKKDKFDKRLKGSVGPGFGNEYMARWTGSKNSFN